MLSKTVSILVGEDVDPNAIYGLVSIGTLSRD